MLKEEIYKRKTNMLRQKNSEETVNKLQKMKLNPTSKDIKIVQ